MARPASSTGRLAKRAGLLGLAFQLGEALGEVGGPVGFHRLAERAGHRQPVGGGLLQALDLLQHGAGGIDGLAVVTRSGRDLVRPGLAALGDRDIGLVGDGVAAAPGPELLGVGRGAVAQGLQRPVRLAPDGDGQEGAAAALAQAPVAGLGIVFVQGDGLSGEGLAPGGQIGHGMLL